jgi:hypothetical protein
VSRLQVALELAARGWHVFPLAPGAKLPAIPAAHQAGSALRRSCRGQCGRGGHGVHDATVRPDVITAWWRHCPTANVGISCGPSGLVVLDLDTPKNGRPAPMALPGIACGADVLAALAERAGAPLPMDTYTVRTGRGGLHLYFGAPAGLELPNTAGRLGWLVDTRADGGYVVGAGSTVAGRDYVLVHVGKPHDLPGWITTALLPPPPATPPRPIGGQRPGYAHAALRNEVQRVLDAPPGQRNATLNRAAYSLGTLVGAGVLPEALVGEALLQAAQSVGLGLPEPAATIASGLRAGTARPRGGGAA